MKQANLICFGICALVSAVIALLFWGPILQFGFSLIPATAEYAWVGKIIVIIFVAYFGGIGIPLAILGLGIFLLFTEF